MRYESRRTRPVRGRRFALITAGVIFAPLVHRVMHELQWEDDA